MIWIIQSFHRQTINAWCSVLRQLSTRWRRCLTLLLCLLVFTLVALALAGKLQKSAFDSRMPDDTRALKACQKMASFNAGNEEWPKDTVVILTPLYNAESWLSRYFENLCSLDYPHHLLRVALGEDSSTDRTVALARGFSAQLKPYFSGVDFFRLDDLVGSRPDLGFDHHLYDVQFRRRAHMAKARNALLSLALRNDTWVMWIDVDVQEIPRDLLKRLMSADKDVMAASCMFRRPITGRLDVYDRNSWRETKHSKAFLRKVSPSFLMLEGYDTALRDYLPRLGRLGSVVKLDGVGGCALLIKGQCHRKGLRFPSDIYEHHIETEALAKMAAKMGFGVFGMPNVQVIHH